MFKHSLGLQILEGRTAGNSWHLKRKQLVQKKEQLTYTVGGKLIYFITQEVRQVENTNCSLKG